MDKHYFDKISSSFPKTYRKLPLGIPDADLFYYRTKSNQENAILEIKQSKYFAKKFLDNLSQKTGEKYNLHDLRFINYGQQQLIYVLKVNGLWHTVSISQPTVEHGKIKEEYDNLRKLADRFPFSVIKPYDYFTDGVRELFMSPYIYQARCLSNRRDGFGMYVPEPNYRFVPFNPEERSLINSCMIAHLISFFNEEKCLGIGDFRLSAGDFILTRDWSLADGEYTLEKMKLIAARKFISMNFSDYTDLIKKEFRTTTSFLMEDTALELPIKTDNMINTSSHFPMDDDEIEKGITFGLKMRSKRNTI